MQNIAQADPSLNLRRKIQRKLPANAKLAKRAILRDGPDGAYRVNVPPETAVGLEDLVLDQQLQLNAMALNISRLTSMVEALMSGQPAKNHPMVANGPAAPFVGDVIPMRSASHSSEKAKPSGSVPLPVPGNEAEVLDFGDGVQLLPAPKKQAEVVHIHGSEVPLTEILSQKPAANDELGVVEGSPRTTIGSDSALYRIIKRRFGFSKFETFKLAKREFERRNADCLRNHGMSYIDVQIMRELKKTCAVGTVDEQVWVAPENCPSAFSQFEHNIEDWEKVKALHLQGAIALSVEKQRAEVSRKQDMQAGVTIVGTAHRVKRGATYSAYIRKMEAVKPPRLSIRETLVSNWKVTKMGWRDSLDRLDRALSLSQMGNGFDWFKAERALYEHDADPNEGMRRWPTLTRNLRKQDYVPRISIQGSPEGVLGHPTPPKVTMLTIGRELIRKGLYSPLEVTIMQGHLASVDKTLALSDTVAVTKE